MASEDTLRQADMHRNAMKMLSMSQNTEIAQAARAILDVMLWLDSNYTDLQKLFASVSRIESELETANDKIRTLEMQIRRQ